MDKVFLSPRQAADRVGCGRSSIMRALSSGDLTAHRDNRNAWRIEAETLDRWASDRSDHVPDNVRTEVSDRSGQDRTPVPNTHETLARLAVAEARLADVIAERDRLAAFLERALEPRPGLIERIVRLIRR
jgi:excisionase family DNA binding protein